MGGMLAGRRPGRFLSAVVLLSTLALATGCGAGESAAEWRGTREVIEGVEVVRNPGAPLLAAGDVGVELLWTASGGGELVAATGVAGATSSEPPEWADPTAIARGGEYLFILDPMESRVYALGAEDGRWLRSIGRKGGGPGELDDPRAIGVLDDVLVVLNGKRGSFDLFTPDGAYLRSMPTQGMTFSFQTLTGGRLLASAMFAGSAGDLQSGWRLFPLAGEPEAMEARPVSVASPGAEAEGGILECMRTGTAGAHIIRFSCGAPHLQLLDDRGRLLGEYLVDRAPDMVTDAELEAQLKRRSDRMALDGIPPAMIQRVLAMTRDESRIRASFSAARQDPATGALALWQQNPDDLGGGPATLHLFSQSGVYLAELHFDRAWVAFDIANATIFALERDPETDLIRAAAYRLEMPEALGREAWSGSGQGRTEDGGAEEGGAEEGGADQGGAEEGGVIEASGGA
jgi:hypothetical protein